MSSDEFDVAEDDVLDFDVAELDDAEFDVATGEASFEAKRQRPARRRKTLPDVSTDLRCAFFLPLMIGKRKAILSWRNSQSHRIVCPIMT